jgi:hypothetical protein
MVRLWKGNLRVLWIDFGRRDNMDRRDWMKGASAMAVLICGVSAQAETGGAETVYELRTYHMNEGKLPLILERFRTKETAIFKRLGMHPVAYWTPTDPPLAGKTLVYLLRHDSRAAADAAWAKFRVDPEWVALKAETEKDGEFLASREQTFLKMTDFSPVV